MSNNSGQLFRELRRRKVPRTMALYVFVCWGLLQVGDIIFPAIGLDGDSASRLLLYGTIGGFPVTFALAWFFQFTPEGIVKTTSFVERRVLDNIAPINDLRKPDSGTYFNKNQQEQTEDHHWVLSVESGPLEGLSFPVNRSLVLGRSLDCDITVLSPHVSRHHARLEPDKQTLTIEDLGSKNGSLVNGVKTQSKHELRHDDELRFQDIAFRVTESYSRTRGENATMDQTTLIPSTDD